MPPHSAAQPFACRHTLLHRRVLFLLLLLIPFSLESSPTQTAVSPISNSQSRNKKIKKMNPKKRKHRDPAIAFFKIWVFLFLTLSLFQDLGISHNCCAGCFKLSCCR
ncbi:unnamed protein product [Citrullus colocynthis]|uniref:Uncharacterized protein n=1 Tax=Citrullus colocynthis TaxID=252529 RepID=A0ABP0YTR6_9ROSI